MRFSASRSASPPPERRRFRGRSSYGLYFESESESDEYELDDGDLSESDFESTESSESSDSSYLRLPDLKVTRREQRPSRRSRTDAEMRYIEDTIAAIRLRTRHQDPYEVWEQQTRKDAFRTARKSLTESQTRWHGELEKARTADLERLTALHAQQMAEVQNHLNALTLQHQKEEQRLKESWKARHQMMQQRIESVIMVEEEKVRKRIEEEGRKRLEEEELKRRLEEEKRRMEARRKEEETRRKAAEEEARRTKEEAERKEAEEKEKEKTSLEGQKMEPEQRRRLGWTTVDEDWSFSRGKLHRLKNEIMKKVKGDKQMKKEWGELRRQITPKIGQLTSDLPSMNRISVQLIHICKPPNAPIRNLFLYHALLSSLSKAIIMQAETEVTAEIRTAEPIAKVALHLTEHLDNFATIFFARLVERVGGWIVPIVVPPTDFDGRQWKDDGERLKAMGYRKGATGEELETTREYCTRISGIMRVYFNMLKFRPMKGPLPSIFRSPRYWTWFARMLGEQHRALLETPASAYLIHTALDVMGTDAKDIWGIQWVKMLALIYEACTKGLPNESGGENLFIGGQTPEGRSARMRVLLEVERIMKKVNTTMSTHQP